MSVIPENKYQKEIVCKTADSNGVMIFATVVVDVYDVLMAWDVTNPAIQHAIKKLLQPGARGHKTRAQDLKEAMQSLKRAIELEDA